MQCQVCIIMGAKHKDEHGARTLCTTHARLRNMYRVRNPCRDCPPQAKKEAIYEDEAGLRNTLCATHAREANTYEVRNPCRDCPDDAKLRANYQDEAGRPNKLCATHAREANTYEVRNPCRDCPPDDKLQASYKDEAGRCNKLCAGCAFEAGLKPLAAAGASIAACECWHRIEAASPDGVVLTHHIHFVKGAAKPTGKEMEGLIPGRRFKPDAYIEPKKPIHLANQNSGPKGAVYLFHGNEWHGYPEGHPKYEDTNHCDTPYKELYGRTLKQQELYKAEGYRVFAVWEDEYKTVTRAQFPAGILSVVQEV